MKVTLITVGAALIVAVAPAAAGLAGNSALSQQVEVRTVPTPAVTDDIGRDDYRHGDAAQATPGDDKGGLRDRDQRTEPGDDRDTRAGDSGRSRHAEPGDDKGGRKGRSNGGHGSDDGAGHR